MIYAQIETPKGLEVALYYRWEDLHRDTFAPGLFVKKVLEFKTHGKTYKERKESARDLAIDFLFLDGEASGGLSWGEWSEITAYFETIGKRYGLLEEFRENAII